MTTKTLRQRVEGTKSYKNLEKFRRILFIKRKNLDLLKVYLFRIEITNKETVVKQNHINGNMLSIINEIIQ